LVRIEISFALLLNLQCSLVWSLVIVWLPIRNQLLCDQVYDVILPLKQELGLLVENVDDLFLLGELVDLLPQSPSKLMKLERTISAVKIPGLVGTPMMMLSKVADSSGNPISLAAILSNSPGNDWID
jgi:hypothetical protein